jgi:hypothetical protein
MDIINIESSLGDMILCDNKKQTSMHINESCKAFNKITTSDLNKHKEEYYKQYIPKKIEETIENKMFAILNNPRNSRPYKKPEEYDVELDNLATMINDTNYDIILAKIVKEYKESVREYYLNAASNYDYMFGILMNEYAKFIKKYMKYEISKKDFDEEENDIYDIIQMSEYGNTE